MSNAKTSNAIEPFVNKPPAIINDGFDQRALELSNNPMRGITLIKYTSDGSAPTAGKERTPIEPTREFVAAEVRYGWQFLKAGCEAEVVMQPIDGPKPERPNSFTEEEDWPYKLNSTTEKQDPWHWTAFLFLFDEKQAQKYVYSTSGVGGNMSIDDLVTQITTMRQANPGAVPVIQLHAQPWRTNFGLRKRPHFKVVQWYLKNDPPSSPLNDGGNGDDNKDGIKVVSDMDDEIPF
jgi:hypothetical protein